MLTFQNKALQEAVNPFCAANANSYFAISTIPTIRALSHLNQWRELEWILSYHRALFPVVLENKGERFEHVENTFFSATSASLQQENARKIINHSLHVYHLLCLSTEIYSTLGKLLQDLQRTRQRQRLAKEAVTFAAGQDVRAYVWSLKAKPLVAQESIAICQR